jgi:hypothetical protein
MSKSMEFGLLVSGLLLVSCVSLGISGIIITRNKGNNPTIFRRRIREYEEDNKSLMIEIRKLKGQIARMKQGPTLTETDIKSGGRNVLDTVIDGLPTNYKKLAKKYKHLVEPLVMDKDGNLKPEVTEKLTDIISKSNSGPKEEPVQYPQSL